MITISKDGLKTHYEHVQKLLAGHKGVPRDACKVIGNLTLREAKTLLKQRLKPWSNSFHTNSGNLGRSINITFQGNKSDAAAIIGSYAHYAPHVEYDTKPHIIRPKKAGGVLAWQSRVFSSLKTKGIRTTKVFSHQTKAGRNKYKNMMFASIVHHPGTKGKFFLRDAIFNIAPQHIPIIQSFLNKDAKI